MVAAVTNISYGGDVLNANAKYYLFKNARAFIQASETEYKERRLYQG